MRAVVQRVSTAKVEIDGKTVGAINGGLVVLLGINHSDTAEQIPWMVEKICNLRIFSDEEGKMNRSLLDEEGEMLIISQFTLYGDCSRGRRPSYSHAARPELADMLYQAFIKQVDARGVKTAQGVFGADMQVSLVNDGPVTLIIDRD